MLALWRDLRSGARQLRRRQGLAAAAIVALGLGVGANAALLSVFRVVILQPPPFPEPNRLVRLWARNTEKGLEGSRISPVAFDELRDQAKSFSALAGWWRPELNLTGEEGEPKRVSTVDVTGQFFETLGVEPMLGEAFAPTDELSWPITKVVLSYRLWRDRFGADRELLGKSILLDGQSYQVVGVMPAAVDFPPGVEVYRPLGWDPGRHSRGARFFEAVGRLAPGVTLAQARAEVASFVTRWQKDFAGTNAGWALDVPGLHDDEVGKVRQGLVLLLFAVGAVLLVACVNVAGLLIAQGTTREREVALRFALGAGRSRLVRQFLGESLVVAGLGGALGAGVAVLGVWGLRALAPAQLPRLDQITVDVRLLLYALLLGIASTLLFGLLPALRSTAGGLRRGLEEGGRGGSSARGVRLRSALVVAEVAFAVVLLVASGLLLRSFQRLLGTDIGVRTKDAMVFNLQLPQASYADYAAVNDFYQRAIDRIAAQPGVGAVASGAFLPLEEGWRCDFDLLGAPAVDSTEKPEAQYRPVSVGWFRALGIPLLEGRGFETTDRADRPGVVVVNAAARQRYWGNASPVGERVALDCRTFGPLGSILTDKLEAEVVGVAANVKNTSLEGSAEPAFYFPMQQFGYRNMSVVVGTDVEGGDPHRLVPEIKSALWQLDNSLPLSQLRTVSRHLASATTRQRFIVALLGAFATLALLLAAIGVHGVLAQAVAEQRRELGVRIAMGATRARIVALVFQRGVLLVLGGLGCGVAGAMAVRRLIASQLYGTGPFDPVALLGVLAVLLLSAALACFSPALRASRTAPAVVLRGD